MMNRREIIRRASVVTAGGVMAGFPIPGDNARAVPIEASPEVQPLIRLDLRGGDVWAWEKQITGTCAGISADAAIVLMVNDETLVAERTDDRFSSTVKFRPGANTVTAVATSLDGSDVSSDTVTHTVRLSPRPTSRITVTVENGSIILDGSDSAPSAYDSAPIQSYRWRSREDNPAPLFQREAPSVPVKAIPAASSEATPFAASVTDSAPESRSMSIPPPSTDGEYYVSLEITDEAGRTDVGSVCLVVQNGQARVVDPLSEEASWVESTVVYGMIVRNFTSEGFRGVMARLEELQALGVTTLWFAPITRTIPGYFGYEVTDYFNVRQEYGTLEDFRTLVDGAHERSIRVLMDFVPNHTSHEHPYFRDAEAHGQSSPYYSFYDRDRDGNYTYYFEWTHLPNLNFDNPEVRRFMTEAFAWWVREFGVDGFRADVAWGIKERRPDYWLEWSAELNRIKPDSLLIAEASARDPFYFHHGFDAAYDWTDELGVWAWGDVFADVFLISTGMRNALTNGGKGYDPEALTFRFLNNNDTGSRFVTNYGLDFYRVSLAMMLTLPGIPCLYTGDEIGAEFLPYETTTEIDWTDPYDLRPYVRKLIALRRDHPSLHSRVWLPLDVEPSTKLLGYLRQNAEGGQPILVLLNFSPEAVEASVPVAADVRELTGAGRLIDLWADERLSVSGGDAFAVSVPAWSLRLLVGAAA
jgi:glycosidase